MQRALFLVLRWPYSRKEEDDSYFHRLELIKRTNFVILQVLLGGAMKRIQLKYLRKNAEIMHVLGIALFYIAFISSDYSAWSFLLSLLFENKQNHYYFLLKDILNCIKRATLCNSCNAWLFKVKVAITGILFVAFNALPDSLLHHFST